MSFEWIYQWSYVDIMGHDALVTHFHERTVKVKKFKYDYLVIVAIHGSATCCQHISTICQWQARRLSSPDLPVPFILCILACLTSKFAYGNLIC